MDTKFQRAIKVATLNTNNEFLDLAKKISKVPFWDRTFAEKEIVKQADDQLRAIQSSLPVISLNKLIQSGGLDQKGLPVLAVSPPKEKTIICDIGNGEISYGRNLDRLDGSKVFFTFELKSAKARRTYYESIVPLIPPEIRPLNLNGKVIVWEALWNVLPRPIDPILLAHLSGEYYGIEATWELTEREVNAMRISRL